MKKMKKLLGLLVLSSMIITGCDEKKVSNVIDNSSNISENNGDNNENNNNNNNENGSGENGTNQDGDNTDNGNGSEYGGDNNGEGGNGENQGNENGDGGGNGGTVAKTDWDDEEKAIFDDYFYGVEVPYMYIEGESPLDVDLEYGYAYKSAPNSSAELLDSYAALFDDTWIDLYADDEEEIEAPIEDINVLSAPTFDDELDDDDDYDLDYEEETYYEYGFSKTIETEAGIRFVNVSLYGGYYDDDGEFAPTADGSGTFTLEIYDPYYYAWPEEAVNYVLDTFELTDDIPAFDGADYYDIYDEFFGWGFVAFLCYTEDDNSITTYIEDLMEIGYELYDTDENGNLYYTNENKEISISVAFDGENGCLIIGISFYYDDTPVQDPYDPNKVDWSDDEKAAISDNFYGLSIPYMNIENENYIRYDEENEFATKTAPNCTKDLLSDYAELFDDSWEDLSCLDAEDVTNGYYFCCYKKAITTDDGVRFVLVRFYGGTYNSYYGDYDNNIDGTGTFVLEVFDPYLYAWPEDLVSEFLTECELTDVVPAYENGVAYTIDDSYIDCLGIIITAEKTEVQTYLNMLTDAGYAFFYVDEEDFDYYTNEAKEISIAVGYDDEDGTIIIYLELYEDVDARIPVTIDFDGDVLDQAFFGLTAGSSSYVNPTNKVGESGAVYSGNMAATNGIQIRSKNKNSGIIASNPDSFIDAIAIVWDNHTTSGKTVYIYASNEPFTISDMYNGNATKVGEITYNKNVGIFDEFDGEYSYVGIRSADGACYLEQIVFGWVELSSAIQ